MDLPRLNKILFVYFISVFAAEFISALLLLFIGNKGWEKFIISVGNHDSQKLYLFKICSKPNCNNISH